MGFPSQGKSSFHDWSEFGQNAGVIENYYQLYKADPALVDPAWAAFFTQLDNGQGNLDFPSAPINGVPQNGHAAGTADRADIDAHLHAAAWLEKFRALGHLYARTSPVENRGETFPRVSEIEESYSADLGGRRVSLPGFANGRPLTAAELRAELERCYCSSVGFEVAHLVVREEREWLISRIESRELEHGFSKEDRLRVLKTLLQAEVFESELHKKYVGQTRFSLEGGESLIPMLDLIRERGPRLGIKEVHFGMAHRGRLNVLLNIMGKPLQDILVECEDRALFSVIGSGDVKYHLGFAQDYTNSAGENIHLSMVPNPSHLEFVNPVVEGVARARQDLVHERRRGEVLPVLIHGDAACIGQGIVAETVNLSRVDGYETGGTLHIVINNQIGFTTDPEESKSTIYCTDMAKAVQAPVFHVNVEDPLACCWVMQLALEFRQKFGRDVLIDLVCYRKYGHNEGDDPSFTQPLMYSEIKRKSPVDRLYSEKLIAAGESGEEELSAIREGFRAHFNAAHEAAKNAPLAEACPVHGRIRSAEPQTGVDLERLQRVANCLVTYPEGFTPHPKLKQILERRVSSLTDGHGIDWGFAEVLAFGSLMLDGVNVRLSGQDCGRGTFSQRHLLLTDHRDGRRYQPFEPLYSHASPSGARFEVFNSPLSEAGVLGFEFGYSSVDPRSFSIWEAQYGDFCNGAQVIIDQFLVNSEQAWGQRSGVVMLLPHAYEGQGPEHSSARIERFLQMAAEGNITVAYPSTAAQHFHLIRRHGLLGMKRPLIVFTPKSLLRSSAAASELSALTTGRFMPLLEEVVGPEKAPKSLVLCCGKVYFDLRAALNKEGATAARLVRIERLYPFPESELIETVSRAKASRVFWVQEEPLNMGPWLYLAPRLEEGCGVAVQYIGRPASASTATGSHGRHQREQKQIFADLIKAINAGDNL